MDRFPAELIYVLFFLAIVLYNVLTGRAARRQRAEEAEEAAHEEPPPPQEPLEEIWVRVPAALRAPAVQAAPVERVAAPRAERPSARPPARRSALRPLLGSRRDLRRAIVLMTVLGPCRAQEQPERSPGP